MTKLFLTSILLQTFLHAYFVGVVVDKQTLKPISGAIISDSEHTIKSGPEGNFFLHTNEKQAHIKAYGYRALQLNSNTNTTTLELEPITVKALYLTFWGASGNSQTMRKILRIIDKKEINAIVVDIKMNMAPYSTKHLLTKPLLMVHTKIEQTETYKNL